MELKLEKTETTKGFIITVVVTKADILDYILVTDLFNVSSHQVTDYEDFCKYFEKKESTTITFCNDIQKPITGTSFTRRIAMGKVKDGEALLEHLKFFIKKKLKISL